MPRPTWRSLLAVPEPLLLPVAHDALSARLIEVAGFRAASVGGFALVGTRHGIPDIGLVGLKEMAEGVRDILAATTLPLMIDGDDGYGDVKNVTRTMKTYERLGAAAIFIEDQVSPKRCGHMAGKSVVPIDVMERKIRAAAAARDSRETFLLARTDARALEGLDGALRRGERYLAAGADGIFIEAPVSIAELERIGRAFKGTPQLANMLEDGATPLMTPQDLYGLGFQMVAYPVSLLFRIVHTMQRALADMQAGTLRLQGEGVSFADFKRLTGFDDWAAIEDRFNR
ncbi:oxaloacetate decarboxylase [Reyranella sp. CPCC 100927]|uniref:isocitrate lyase/PEP mutase family protein n=1 Tax=Reyranella sp. CPCC 100927 TaxID=2599616 RepID=UPI0015B4F409|nr:isocitrate lyase/PEP mutase family protein [Reyranella sp. CPCC 100927]